VEQLWQHSTPLVHNGRWQVTVRAPLKYVDANTLQEMSTDEVTAWVDHICYLYGGSPSVTLTVDTGSAQNLQAMSDTRLQAGAVSNSATAFVAEATTAEPEHSYNNI
jgi:hypothetical protein